MFARSIRTVNFTLYKESMQSLLPWFFALDHIYYARWLSVHLTDIFTFTFTLKTLVRRKRGQGIRRRVLSDSKIPGNWHSFLRIKENTEYLLKLLAVEVSEIQTKGSCIHLLRNSSIQW